MTVVKLCSVSLNNDYNLKVVFIKSALYNIVRSIMIKTAIRPKIKVFTFPKSRGKWAVTACTEAGELYPYIPECEGKSETESLDKLKQFASKNQLEVEVM